MSIYRDFITACGWFGETAPPLMPDDLPPFDDLEAEIEKVNALAIEEIADRAALVGASTFTRPARFDVVRFADPDRIVLHLAEPPCFIELIVSREGPIGWRIGADVGAPESADNLPLRAVLQRHAARLPRGIR